MKVSEKWLRESANPSLDTAGLVQQLTMAGLEVDAVLPAAAEFSGVVVGVIDSITQHPDADKLRVCQVSDGQELFQVVCGASNARAGLKVPFAKLGAVLPQVTIKKAKLRGVESFGMLCAAEELGMADQSNGLLELPDDAPLGKCLRDYLGLDDRILELDLTPNRGDCLSIRGLAREVSAITGCDYHEQRVEAVPAEHQETRNVRIDAGAACPRYVGRVLRGIQPVESPLWMRERLRRAGLRSIDIVVDVTNLVLLEMGQPMHAFDLASLKGDVVVRLAEEGETLTLLNGQEATLKPGSLLIADSNGPLALAGVMGGADSAVGVATTDIFLESAFFAPLAMAGVARAHGLHTDASHRFERGVDPSLQVAAMERATALLISLCGAKAGPLVVVEAKEHLPHREAITLREARIRDYLGLTMTADEVRSLLERLGMLVGSADQGWRVIPPSHRFDIAIEEDLLEELARVYGYNRLPVSMPMARAAFMPADESQVRLSEIRRRLIARGYQEAITYSFVSPELQSALAPDVEPVQVSNPISSDMSVMRSSLWPGLVVTARHNLSRQQARVRIFETGLCFTGKGPENQSYRIGGLVTGSRFAEGWSAGRDAVDFFDAKGDVEALLGLTARGECFQFRAAAHPALHPGQTAQILLDDTAVGWLGALHPSLVREWDLPPNVLLFELDLTAVGLRALPVFSEVSRYPAVRRDLALLVDSGVPVAAMEACARQVAGTLLKELVVFDVYQGKTIDTNRKSVALGLTFQESSRTLNEAEINDLVNQVITALETTFNASLRT